MVISERLKVQKSRFIRVKPNSKVPKDVDWQNTKNFIITDPILTNWISEGNNYGIACGYGNVLVIDADTKEIIDKVERAGFGDTFVVKTGSGGRHYYYIVDSFPKTHPLNKGKENVGHLRWIGGQVVGPGSTHPNGNKYEVLKDSPIKEVSGASIIGLFKEYYDFRTDIPLDEVDVFVSEHKIAGIDIGKIINLNTLTKTGPDTYQGPHPIHGSSTGLNFVVDTKKGVWYCFRCGSGGGAMSLIAVINGVISCSDAHRGSLRGEAFTNAYALATDKYGYVAPANPTIKPSQTGAPAVRELKALSVTELRELAKIETDWIVNPLIPAQATILVAARPKSMKTYLLMDMAYAIAEGRLWLDRFLTKQCGVLYIDGEMGPGRLAARTVQLTKTAETYGGIHFFSHLGIKLDNKADYEAVRKWLTEHKEVRLVIVDTLRRLTSVEENDATEISNFLTMFVTPLVIDFKVSVIIVHHTRKRQQGNNGGKQEDDMDEVRGSGDLSGFVDVILMLKRYKGEDSRLVLKQEGSRYKEEIDEQVISAKFDNSNNTATFTCEGTPTDHTRQAACMKRILEFMLVAKDYEISSIEEEMLKYEFKHETVKKALSRLVKDKVLIRPPETKGTYRKPTGGLSDFTSSAHTESTIAEVAVINHGPAKLISTCAHCGEKEQYCSLDDKGNRICRNCKLLKDSGGLVE